MIAESGAAISSIKAAMDIAKGVNALKSEAEINQAIIDIQRILLDAQSAALEDKIKISSLQDSVRDLQTQLESIDHWNHFKEKYALTESELGCFTYNLKVDSGSTDPFHRLCAPCFEQKTKSILQTYARRNGGEIVDCPTCKTRFHLSEFRDPPIQNNTSGYF